MTPAELERLAILSEEAGEVVQAVGKIIRHGYLSHHPSLPTAADNRGHLEKELGDLMWIIRLMKERGDVDGDSIEEAADSKEGRVQKYLHHQ